VAQEEPQLKSFLIDVGNSTDGPIGMSIRVMAVSKEEAIQLVKDSLPECVQVDSFVDVDPAIEYVNVYLNATVLTVRDIDDSETEDV